jgi:uncharacterized protein GlcG (DUF336 family)
MITVRRLTLEDAKVMLEAAERRAREIGVSQTICVCDDGGHPIALHRMTGARLTGVEIAIAKAFTAAGHRRPTHGFPVEVEGEVVGGIGVSGGNGEQDVQVAEAGLEALRRALATAKP